MQHTLSLRSMQGKEDGRLLKLNLRQQPEVKDAAMRWRPFFFLFLYELERLQRGNINHLRAVKRCKSLRPPVEIDGQLEGGGNVKISHCNCYLSLCRSGAVQPQLSNPPPGKTRQT